ncbi:MAG: hypothetical protein ABI467_12560 [Kofleriaceae bacterium]
MRTYSLAVFLVVVAACGSDAARHIGDAPPPPSDAASDAPDAQVSLNITIAGSGTGTVTSAPAGITCTTASCSADFDRNTVVTLTAMPDTGSVFAGWAGAGCTDTTPTCEVTLAQAAAITATFEIARYAVTVMKSGAGTGTVAGGGLDCGGTCTIMVDHGTVLSLTATPANLSVFAGWGGVCSGTAGCTTTVTGPTTISANFALDNLTLFVVKGGNGAGTVTATGIACGADCSESYTAGQMVTLTAAAATGSSFTGWSGGGCTGTGTCTVTMTAAMTVTATFALDSYALAVTEAGAGGGTVTSVPTGINCPTTCTKAYLYLQSVVLTAAADGTSNFAGWSGAGCTGTGTCTVSMTQARAVTATFTKQQFTLQITKGGDGTGTVSGSGLNCGSTCTVTLSYGTPVTLTATGDSADATASTLTAWSGAGCTGAGQCTFTITANTTVNASFTLSPNLMFTTLLTYTGNLGGLAGADTTCQKLAENNGLKGNYRAYLGATGIDAPSRFLDATGWTRVDGKPMIDKIGEFGTVALRYPPSIDETGADLSQSAQLRVWTATKADTTYFNENCPLAGAVSDWSGTAGRTNSGVCTARDSAVLIGGEVQACTASLHLYCFEIDRKATVP